MTQDLLNTVVSSLKKGLLLLKWMPGGRVGGSSSVWTMSQCGHLGQTSGRPEHVQSGVGGMAASCIPDTSYSLSRLSRPSSLFCDTLTLGLKAGVFRFILVILIMCMCVYGYQAHECKCSPKSEVSDPPGAGVTGTCCECWKLNSDPQEGQYLLLVIEPSLQPLELFL